MAITYQDRKLVPAEKIKDSYDKLNQNSGEAKIDLKSLQGQIDSISTADSNASIGVYTITDVTNTNDYVGNITGLTLFDDLRLDLEVTNPNTGPVTIDIGDGNGAKDGKFINSQGNKVDIPEGELFGVNSFKYDGVDWVLVQKNLKNNYVNIKDFGAKGDGLTDNTQALLDAISFLGVGGGTIFVPRGSYLISQAFELVNINLIGEGYGSEILKDISLQNVNFLTLSDNSSLLNIKVNGNFINMVGVNDTTLGNLIQLDGTNLMIDKIYLEDSDGSSIASRNAHDVSISNIYMSEFQDHALYFSTNCDNINVNNFIAKSSGGTEPLKVRNGGKNINFTNGYATSNRHFISISSDTAITEKITFQNINGTCKNSFLVMDAEDVLRLNDLIKIINCNVENIDVDSVCILNRQSGPLASTKELLLSNCTLKNFTALGIGGGGGASGEHCKVENNVFYINDNSLPALSVNGYKRFDFINNHFVGSDVSLTSLVNDIGECKLLVKGNTIENLDTVVDVGNRADFLTYEDVIFTNNVFSNVLRMLNCSATDGLTKKNFFDINNFGTLPNPNFRTADYIEKIISFNGVSNNEDNSLTKVIDYKVTMGDSVKDPTTVAPDDWVEVKINGVTHYIPSYL